MPNSAESYLTSDWPTPFLRLETPRERIALPYATLLGMTLSPDETTIEMDFAAKTVVVKGKRLHEIFCAIACGRSQALFARSATAELAAGPGNRAPLVLEIRIRHANPATE